MYGTTRAFLDYFNLKSLDELPPLDEIRDLIEPQLAADAAAAETAGQDDSEGGSEGEAVPEGEAERPLAEVVQLPVAPRSHGGSDEPARQP